MALFLATGAGAGYGPIAPGTWGSALGVLLFWPLAAGGTGLYVAVLVALLAAGIWAAGEVERGFASKDDGRIVIDEVVGQLLALVPLVGEPASWGLLAWLVTGFVAFRVFDIWKPGPARWAERRFAGGWGVMLDDVVAGAFAALLVAALRLGVSG